MSWHLSKYYFKTIFYKLTNMERLDSSYRSIWNLIFRTKRYSQKLKTRCFLHFFFIHGKRKCFKLFFSIFHSFLCTIFFFPRFKRMRKHVLRKYIKYYKHALKKISCLFSHNLFYSFSKQLPSLHFYSFLRPKNVKTCFREHRCTYHDI
jgi:hypothetical protein